MNQMSVSVEAATKPGGLFTRLPGLLFRPLASANREHLWSLLLRLYDRFFGPEAEQPDDGFEHRTITAEIERFLVETPDWVTEDGEPHDSPLSVRANMALRRLTDSGWLREERIGLRNFLVMRPVVTYFLGVLKQFAEEGPQIVGGQVQAIFNNLQAVQRDPHEQGAAFHQAALDTVRLVSTLNATGVRVREVMELLGQEETTAGYIRAFFGDYISAIYIRDYHELRTQNHPLRHRHDILRIVSELNTNAAARDTLKEWYSKTFRLVDPKDIETALTRDIDRFRRFHNIQTYLDRLDDSVNRATRQALSYIHYKLRVQGRIERLLSQTVEACSQADAAGLPIETPFATGLLFNEALLREPRVAKQAVPRSAIKRREMTPREKAVVALRRLMMQNRQISTAQVKKYLDAHVPAGREITSDDLPIVSVNDLCVYVALGRAAFAQKITGHKKSTTPEWLRPIRDVRISAMAGEWCENEFLRTARFRIDRKGGA
jgi:hypothetical protein